MYMRCFARDKDGKVFEVDKPGDFGIVVTCEEAIQAEQMFKQLESAFPAERDYWRC